MISEIKKLTFEFDAQNRHGWIGITCERDEDGREIAERFLKRIHFGIGPVHLEMTESELSRGWPRQLSWWAESFAKTWESQTILDE